MKKLTVVFGAALVGIVFSFVMTLVTARTLQKERDAAVPAQGLPLPVLPQK